jgi:hypothetical protein
VSLSKNDSNEVNGPSLYLRDVRRRAAAEQRTEEEVRTGDQERVRAIPEDTDACLLPDEAESLLRLPGFAVTPDAVRYREGDDLNHALKAAIGHVEQCAFCRAMLLSMEPAAAEERRFLSAIAEMAAEEQHKPELPKGVGLVPVLIPSTAALIGVVAFFSGQSMGAAILVEWKWLAIAVALAVVGLAVLRWLHTRPATIQGGVSAAVRHRRRVTHLAIAAAAPLAITILSTISAVRTDREIAAIREDAVQSLAQTLILPEVSPGTPDSSQNYSIDPEAVKLLANARFAPAGPNTLKHRETLHAPGDIVARISDNNVRLYWEIYGKQVDTVKLQVKTASPKAAKPIASTEPSPASSPGAKSPSGSVVATQQTKADTGSVASTSPKPNQKVAEDDRTRLATEALRAELNRAMNARAKTSRSVIASDDDENAGRVRVIKTTASAD